MTLEGIKEFLPQTATAQEWSMFHEFRRVRHEESRPEDPFTPNDVVEKLMKRYNPHQSSRYFALTGDSKMIGTLAAGASKPESPDYEENKHILWGSIAVHPEYRRRGIGSSFLPFIDRLMEEYGSSVFTTDTEEDSGRGFLKWLGAEPKMVGAENRLDFKAIDWEMIESWIREGAERSPASKLELYEDRLPESILEEYCPVYSEVLNQQPFDDLDVGKFAFTPEVFREQYRRFDEVNGAHHTLITREPDGAISGLTEIIYFPHRPNHLTQNLTGVVEKYRGRGIGKWLKAAMLDYARSKYADLEWVITGNANSNDPMLSINKRLGFKEYKGGEMYQLPREELQKFVPSSA